jgi:tetratricopeptide (TPR) repeat protein
VDRTLVAEMNDYGFYLEETGRYAEAVDVLTSVWNVDATRAVVYLNLADAQFALGRTADARPNYARYAELMTQAGKAAKIPPRVAERSK